MKTKDLIISWREYFGLDQGRFAEKIGVSVAAISLWERGKRKNIQPKTAQEICKKLKITYQQFIAGPPTDELKTVLTKREAAIEEEIKTVAQRLGIDPGIIRELGLLVFLRCGIRAQRSFVRRYFEIKFEEFDTIQDDHPEQNVDQSDNDILQALASDNQRPKKS